MADDKELAAKITEANKQKSLAEAREADAKAEKQIIETRKAARDFERDNGKIPEISALNGKITATDNFIETKILANCCLSYLIEELIETMNCDDKFKKNIEKAANNTKAAPTKFIFYNANDIPVLEQYMATSQQLSILTDCFKKILQLPKTELKTDTDSPSGGTGIIELGLSATGILRTAIDFVSLFRHNNTIANIAPWAADENLIVSIFNSKKTDDWEIYFPSTFPIHTIDPYKIDSTFVSDFIEAQSLNSDATKKQKEVEKRLYDIEMKLLEVTDQAKIELEKEKMTLLETVESIKNTCSVFSQQQTTLLSIDPTSGQSLLSKILKGEKIVTMLKTEKAYIIKINATLNGSTNIKENLFSSAKISFSGGADLSCIIFSNEGTVYFSHYASKYASNKTSKEVSFYKLKLLSPKNNNGGDTTK